MITCAECGKRNKDDATVCKYCGYNPTMLRNNAAWNYQNGYPNMPYPAQPPQPTNQYYYDASGQQYSVKYDYVVTPVGGENDYEDDEEEGTDKVMLYPYNPTVAQQPTQEAPKKNTNPMAWVGYFLAMFIDILAWPFCLIGLAIAKKRGGVNKEVCEGGMMFTLMRLVTALVLFLVWLGVKSFIPQFFVGSANWKEALVKIVGFGWPVVVGSIFSQCGSEGSGLKLAGKGYFFFSIALAVAGVIFFDVSILPIFS